MFHIRLSVVVLVVILAVAFSGFSEARSTHFRTSEESSEERPHHSGSRRGHGGGHRGRGRSMMGQQQDGRSVFTGLGSTLGNLLGVSANSQAAIQQGTDILAANAGTLLSNLYQNALGSGKEALVSKAREALSGLAQQAVNAGSTMIVDKGQELLTMAASAAANKAYDFGKGVLENKASSLIGDLAETAMRTNPSALLAEGEKLLQSMISLGFVNPTANHGSEATTLGDIAKIITNVVSM